VKKEEKEEKEAEWDASVVQKELTLLSLTEYLESLVVFIIAEFFRCRSV
jgi:hypothetical protein